MNFEAWPDKLTKVTVHGANIATTLYTVTAGGPSCDGLLFGETVTTTTQHLRDDDDTATVTESRAAVTAAICCASTCSFYDDVGELSESTLDEFTEQQSAPLLGWISYRPSSVAAAAAGSLRPSMRESAVTLALLRRQLGRYGGKQAMLLLLVTKGSDHNGATLTWQFRCFQARLAKATGEMLLEPLELRILNLGGHTGQAAYQELNAATTLASQAPRHQEYAVQQISFSTAGSQVQGGATGVMAAQPTSSSALPGLDQTALSVLATGGKTQVAAVKQHCEALLTGLHKLCGQAAAGEEMVAALRRRRDALLAQLGRMS